MPDVFKPSVFMPPRTTARMRAQRRPTYVGEVSRDDATGVQYSGQMINGDLVWAQSGLSPMPNVGDVLIAADDGLVEIMSVYPTILNQLASSLANLAAVAESTNV